MAPTGRASPLTSESRLSCGIQPHLQTGNTMAHREWEGKRSCIVRPPPVLREWGPEGKACLRQRAMGRWTVRGEGKEGARSSFPGKHEEHGSFRLNGDEAAVGVMEVATVGWRSWRSQRPPTSGCFLNAAADDSSGLPSPASSRHLVIPFPGCKCSKALHAA